MDTEAPGARAAREEGRPTQLLPRLEAGALFITMPGFIRGFIVNPANFGCFRDTRVSNNDHCSLQLV